MVKKKYTKKELDALWGLINYPTLNDKYLAKKTNLKLSTVTAIRRRLREKGYFQTVNIPNFYRLGFELLSVEYGPFNETVPIERRIKFFKKFLSNDPNSIFSLMSRSNGVVLNITRNYAEANEHYAKLETFFTEHNLSDETGWKRVIFPFQNSMFWNFFDFSPVIRYSYDIKRKINLKEFSSKKEVKSARLGKKARKILYGLARYPEESDKRIADRFGVSRQAVSSLKKRFLKEDLMSTRRVMNFEYTGCELIMGTDADGEIKSERSQDGICFDIDENVDPDALSNFPATLNIACNGEVIVIFVTYGTDTLSYIGQSGSFIINGREENHSIYGSFSFSARDYDTGNNIRVSDGQFHVPREY